jgi:nucleotide-binding universal stress UspA family protein
MYQKIMTPVDLAHADKLEKAIAIAADLARHYDVPLCFVGVTAETRTEVARTPGEYEQKLEEFGAAQSAKYGLTIETAAYSSHDPTVDLNKTLVDASNDVGADLIVMASHHPGLAEHIFSSHGGGVAAHATASVFVVR